MKTYHQDRWVPVGLENQLMAASSHPVIIEGYGVAAWRGEDGGPVQIWEDRCPHRGMRLSFGFVRDNHLTCLYHGWTYGSDGRCSKIPAHPDLQPPRTICARTYTSASVRGIVFANLSDAPAAALVPDNDDWQPVRSIYVNCAPDHIRDCLASADNPFQVLPQMQAADVYEIALPNAPRLTLALQPVSEHKTALHVSAATDDLATRLNLARQLVQIRHAFEQP